MTGQAAKTFAVQRSPYLALMAAAVMTGLWWAHPTGLVGGALLVGLNAFVVLSLAVGTGGCRPAGQRGAVVLLIAQVFSCAAYAYWYGAPWLTGSDLPAISLVDALFLTCSAGNAAAVGILGRHAPGLRRRGSMMDVLIATTGLSVLSWVFLIQPYVHNTELGLSLKLVSIAYPALDLLLVVLLLRLAFDGRNLTPAKVFLLAWGCLQLAGDSAYSELVLVGKWTMTSPVFLLWMGAFGCLIAAALHPTMRMLGEPVSGKGRSPALARPVIVFASVLILPVLLILRVIEQNSDDLPVIAAASLIIFVLVLLRGSAVRNRQSSRSDRIALLRLIAGFTVGALLPLGLMAESSIRLTERVVASEARDRVHATSAVSAQLVQKQMESLAQLVRSYAERRLLAASLGDGTLQTFDHAAVRRHLIQLRAAMPVLSGVFVSDASGRRGDGLSRNPAVVGQDLSSQDWYQGALGSGRPYISRAFATTLDGPPRAVAVAAPVRRPSDGGVVGFLVAVYDLHAIQAFSSELSRAQGVRLRINDQGGTTLAASAADGTTLVDTGGEEVLSTQALVKGLGWTVTAEVPTATAYASLWQLRSRVLAVAVLLGQVLLGGLVLMVQAQRQRQEAEQNLLEREESTRGILEAAADAFISIDKTGVVTSWSRQAERLFGWTAPEAIGSSLGELIVPPALRQQHAAGLHRLITTGVPTILGQRIEVSAIHREGREFPIELAVWQSEVGGQPSFNAFVHDISDRKQYEAQLAGARDEALEASRVKTEFLAVMSHELRTPMNGVMGMTSLLLGTDLSAEQRDYAETVRSSADNLLDLLNDVLDLSKVEAGRLELEVLDFDLHQLVSDVIYLLKVNAQDKGITLTAAIDEDVRLAFRGDPGRLRQVLLNLVGNAVKFTGHGSVHLRVRSDRPPSPDTVAGDRLSLRFEIIDTGIGIAPEVRERLFESFSQADASTTRRFGGTGLGLAISRSLVSMFEGEIGVESELGVGSTFWFTAQLLAGTLSPAPPRPDEATGVQPSATPSLVLVVDDNATNQKIAVRMLEALGHRADVAADGVEAVSAWASVPYDLILMDCQMPLMDGYEAARSIRAAEAAGRRTPIVAMTASAMAEDRERCLDAGMDDFLSKPVQLSDVRDAVNRWLNRSPETAATAPGPLRTALVEDHAPVLDEAIIAELRSYGRDFLIPLVEEFMTTVPERLAGIRAAVGDGDPERLARAAHALRGGTATMGAVRVAQACAEIEEAGVRGDLAAAVRLMPVLEMECARLLTAVSSLLDVPV